ncbi:MAG: FtsK/SpoIIIE domain-containing protein [Chloroflexota bacterium]
MGVLGRGRSLIMMVPMGLSVVASIGFALYSRMQSNKEREAKEASYLEQLIEIRQDMENSHDLQKRFYIHSSPNDQVSVDIINRSFNHAQDRAKQQEHGQQNPPADGESRLWERRPTDPDFLTLRLGLGSLPSTTTYKIQGEGEFEDPLMREALRLQDDGNQVDHMPISIPIRGAVEVEGQLPRPNHALGIIGLRSGVMAFLYAALTNIIALHSPKDLRIVALSQSQAEERWNWAISMPHFYADNPDLSICFEAEPPVGEPNSETGDHVTLFLKHLQDILDDRQIRMSDQESGDVTLPHMLLIVDMLDGRPGWSILNQLENHITIATIVHRGYQLGMSILFLGERLTDIPSGCSGIVEIQSSRSRTGPEYLFRYVEVGINSPRYTGRVDSTLGVDQLKVLAQKLDRLDVRKSYGTELPRGVMMLDMVGCSTMEQLKAQTRHSWLNSRRDGKGADWLEMKLGMIASGEYRKMKFSAAADGVHGMIAGSTGSGKSELLMTMILELALNYDPSVLNFVLVDFKGGGAFKPLEKLPHVVDVVTNLEGSAVDRMFASITAELNRRQAINAETNSKDLVHYRSRGLHEQSGHKPIPILQPDGSYKDWKPRPYPHLFVFIDEFAEMVAENAEYKAQLNSITRLGRALGVTLILAAQRPAGAVTDQMRANIKFRICLRVESREDSSEVLRRPDAAFLPTGIPGRGYLQVVNENLELVQVAWSGANYNGGVVVKKPDVIWVDLEKEKKQQQKDQASVKVIEAMVTMIRELSSEDERPKQQTPWPDPLPRNLSLQTEVETKFISGNGLNDLLGDVLGDKPAYATLNPAVEEWLLNAKRGWDPIDWIRGSGTVGTAMRALVGIVDNPFRAEQFPLVVDLRRNGHLVLFGASGYGKTTFLRTLLTTLAVTHSPADLHAYILDFAGGRMNLFQDLPHVGSVIAADEEELVKRLLRRLVDTIDERRVALRQQNIDDIYIWNHQHCDRPEARFPAIMLMVDNFAEFKESFEGLLPTLISIVREGRAFGVHVILAAEQPNAVSGKLYGLFTQRLALKLSDTSDYVGVVGRGAKDFGEIDGRGFVRHDRTALEFQTALPVAPYEDGDAQRVDITQQLVRLIENLRDHEANIPESRLPKPIKPIPLEVFIEEVIDAQSEPARNVRVPIGIDDRSLAPWFLDLKRVGPHVTLLGPPSSGKTTALRTMIYALASRYSPAEVQIVLVDFQRRLMTYDGRHSIGDLPHVLEEIRDISQIGGMIKGLEASCRRLEEEGKGPSIFVMIDNFSGFTEELEGEQRKDRSLAYTGDLARMARNYGTAGLHFVLSGGTEIARINSDLRKRVTASRFGIGLQTADAVNSLNGKAPRGLAETEPPPGRGFVVKAGKTSMIQIATPYRTLDEAPIALDRLTQALIKKYADVPAAVWPDMADEPSGQAQVIQAPAIKKKPAAARSSTRDALADRRAQLEKRLPRASMGNRSGTFQLSRSELKKVSQQIDIDGLRAELLEQKYLTEFLAPNIPPEGIISTAVKKGVLSEEQLEAILKEA